MIYFLHINIYMRKWNHLEYKQTYLEFMCFLYSFFTLEIRVADLVEFEQNPEQPLKNTLEPDHLSNTFAKKHFYLIAIWPRSYESISRSPISSQIHILYYTLKDVPTFINTSNAKYIQSIKQKSCLKFYLKSEWVHFLLTYLWCTNAIAARKGACSFRPGSYCPEIKSYTLLLNSKYWLTTKLR